MKWLFSALLAPLLWLGVVGSVRAAYEGCFSTASANNGAECADEGSAWQGATAYANAFVSGFNSDPSNVKNKYSVSISSSYTIANSPSAGYTTVRVRVVRETGTVALSADRRFLAASTCSKRAPLNSGWSSAGSGASCSSGCAYGPATSSERMTVAGTTYFSLAGASPTGASCVYGDGTGEQLTADKCVQQGSLTQCVKSDGRQCAVSSSGKQFCWSPSEAGTKSSGNEGATKSPASANINPPKTPPANGGDWQQTGQSTSSTTSGGATTNYNVTGWGSSYGSQGSGGDGDGEGDGDGDGDGYGSPGEGVGDIYDKSDKTVEGVFSDFKGKVQDAPIFKSATGFLGGCSGGGQCPNETWDGGMWAGKFDLSQLCSGALGTLMNYAGFVFLAAMAAVGFRWALL